MRLRPLLIALLSLSLLTIELIWTRIFSAEFLYTFAFLILSTAVLGLGVGALIVRLFPRLDVSERPGSMLALTGAACLAGPPAVFLLDVDFTHIFSRLSSVADVAAVMLILSAPFVFGGIVLASLFREQPYRLPQLYTADLLGAAAGVLLAIPAMNLAGTPAAAGYAAIPVLGAAVISSRSWRRLPPIVLIALTIPLAQNAESLLRVDREQRAPVSYVHWDAMSKIKVYDYSDTYRGIEIDNAANSPVYGFDGNWDRPDSLRFRFGIDVSYLIERMPGCRFLSLGAGGGCDVLQALQSGAMEVHAVEINGHINEMMQHGVLQEFSGGIYNDPRVVVVTEDARTYVRRHPGSFDMIYSLSSNSFAALASGSFALAENYLFTTDAFADYWDALSPRGFMMMEHQLYVPRLVGELMTALGDKGIDDPGQHFAVYDLPRMHRKMILLSKRPMDEKTLHSAFGPLALMNGEDIRLLYPAPDSLRGNLVDRIATEGWQTVAADADIDLSPCSDDRPYTAQLGMWKNLEWTKLQSIGIREMLGYPVATLMILIILAVVVVLVIPLNLLPFLSRERPVLGSIPWLYFFCIGAAFMTVEIMLIQRYTLFLGASVYSAAAVLFAMLVGSGIGSRLSERVDPNRAFAGLLGWLILEIFLFPVFTSMLATLPLAGRMITSVVLLFPLALFMGMPFPRGGVRIGTSIDWGFAVNGAASVLGSALVMLIAFELGIRVALLWGGTLYAVSWMLFRMERRWPAPTAPPAAVVTKHVMTATEETVPV